MGTPDDAVGPGLNMPGALLHAGKHNSKIWWSVLNGERVESVTPIKSIEEVKNMLEIISMLPIETIEEVVSMEKVKYIEEIKEGIARKFIKKHNLVNMGDENGNRKKYKSNSDRGDDFTYEEEDCKELLEDFERTEVEIAIVESVLEDH